MSGCSQIGYVDVEADDPSRIIGLAQRPVLPLGGLGTFDDNGIMPSWIVTHRGQRFLYYIGWNLGVTVPYRLAIGLALSDGSTFVKYSDGPVCDRSAQEPYFNTAPSVIVGTDGWRMWYVSCTGWELVDGRPEPRYRIQYAQSKDGFNWLKTGIVCIDYDEFAQAIGRPCVYKNGNGYTMFYSYRSTHAYRDDSSHSYRLGFADSQDGLTWTRRDADVGIGRSESGWDSQMLEYCSVYEHRGRMYMLYNGNGFGQSGFGYAVLEPE
jgi:hypothetical protein